jgi:hypothetical protein
VVAVPRALHLRAGIERLVPKLSTVFPLVPRIGDVAVLDPAQLGADWPLAIRPIDHVLIIDAASGPESCVPATTVEVLHTLTQAASPVTETKHAVLQAVTAAVEGAGRHRLFRTDPAAMRDAVLAVVH